MKNVLRSLSLLVLVGCNANNLTIPQTSSTLETTTVSSTSSAGTSGASSPPANNFTVTNNVYVAKYTGNSIYQYNLDANTGEIQEMENNINAPTGLGTCNVVMHPNKKFIYSANCLDGTISQFTVNADGSLAPFATRDYPFTAQAHIQEITFDSTGQHMFAKVYNGLGWTFVPPYVLYEFSVDTTTGALANIGAVANDTVNPGSIANYLQTHNLSMPSVVTQTTFGSFTYELNQANEAIYSIQNGIDVFTTYSSGGYALLIR